MHIWIFDFETTRKIAKHILNIFYFLNMKIFKSSPCVHKYLFRKFLKTWRTTFVAFITSYMITILVGNICCSKISDTSYFSIVCFSSTRRMTKSDFRLLHSEIKLDSVGR